MKKSVTPLFCLIGAMILFGCSNDGASTSSIASSTTSSTPSTSSNVASTESGGDSSSTTSTVSSSSSSQITPFNAPQNPRIEEGYFKWDEVAEATLGYKVRINDSFTINVTTTSVEISSIDYTYTRGLNYFEVRTEATNNHLVSRYTERVSYLHGANVTSAQEFIEKVNAIETVSLESIDALDEAKNLYSQLDSVDRLVEGVSEAYEKLVNYDAQEFLLLVNDAKDAVGESKETAIQKAASYYDSLLDKENDLVINALSIPMTYDVKYEVYNFSSTESTLITYAFGINVLNNKVSSLAPVIKQGDVTLPTTGENGVYYTAFSSDISLFFNDNKISDIAYVAPLEGGVTSIVGLENIGFSSVSSATKYKVSIYNNDSVTLSDKVELSDVALASFEVNYNYFMMSKAKKALSDSGINTSLDVALLIEAMDGNSKGQVTVSSVMKNKHIEFNGELKLSLPNEVYPSEMKILENGDIDYKWEIITTNSEWTDGYIEYMEFRIYDASLTFEGVSTPTKAIYTKASTGFIYSQDIISCLKENKVVSDIPLSIAMRFVSTETSPFASSDFTVLEGSYAYVVDNRLSTYGNIYVDSSTGRLVWPWEIFMPANNKEADNIECLRVYIFDSACETPSEESSLGSFDIYFETTKFTYKEDIENALFNNGLSTGSYRFSAKIIPNSSDYTESNFYPITGSYEYTVKALEEVNLALNSAVTTPSYSYAANGGLEKASNAVDGNYNSSWRSADADGKFNNAWIEIDLSKGYSLSKISVYWEAACCLDYDVYVLDNKIEADYDGDFSEFTPIYSGSHEFVNGVNPTDNCIKGQDFTSAEGRYVLINCKQAASAYGNNLLEIEVYADALLGN